MGYVSRRGLFSIGIIVFLLSVVFPDIASAAPFNSDRIGGNVTVVRVNAVAFRIGSGDNARYFYRDSEERTKFNLVQQDPQDCGAQLVTKASNKVEISVEDCGGKPERTREFTAAGAGNANLYFFKESTNGALRSVVPGNNMSFRQVANFESSSTGSTDADANRPLYIQSSGEACKDLIVGLNGSGGNRWAYIPVNGGPRNAEYNAVMQNVIPNPDAASLDYARNAGERNDLLFNCAGFGTQDLTRAASALALPGIAVTAGSASGSTAQIVNVGFSLGQGRVPGALFTSNTAGDFQVGTASTAGLIGTEFEAAAAAATNAVEEGEGGDPECAGGPFSWILCPAIEYTLLGIDELTGFLDSQLQFRLLSENPSPIQNVWGTVLNVANILLAFAFMVIIFSQSTSFGLSNYGIKRMLPRLVAAAILMNISFYICALAIDISNIFGNSVAGLLANGFSSAAGANFNDGFSVGLSSIVGTVLVGAALLILLFIFLVPVLLSVLTVFLVLIARQLILVLLVIVSPIAFALWILPNTEKYFKKWWQLFFQMLILYPMVMFVFGASIFLANLIGNNVIEGAAQDAPLGGVNNSDTFSAVVQLVVLALPLFALPLIFKASSGLLGRINDMTNRGVNRLGGDKLREGNQKLGKRARALAGAGAIYGAGRLNQRFDRRTRRRAAAGAAGAAAAARNAVSPQSRAARNAAIFGRQLQGADIDALHEQALAENAAGDAVVAAAADTASSERAARVARRNPMRAINAARALGYALDTRPEFRKQQRLEAAQGTVANTAVLQAIGGGRADYYQQIRDKNFSEQVSRSSSGIQARIDANDQQRFNKLGDVLADAIRSGNAVEARAAQEILLNSGGGGIEKVREAFQEVGQPAIAGNAELARRLQEGINDNWTQVKTKVPDLAAWSPDINGSVQFTSSSTITDEQVAKATGAALERAISSGALKPDQAADVYTNPTLAPTLSPGSRQALLDHAGQALVDDMYKKKAGR